MESLAPRLILVPTDFSETAAHAMRYASALAERFQAHLLVIYADPFVPPIDFTGTATGGFGVSRGEMIDAAAEELIKHAEENISASVPYDTRVVVESPVRAILEQAHEAGCDLIVMGTHGRTGVRRLVVGSVTETIMRSINLPVLAVNSISGESAAINRVLCPVTYTEECRDALRHAASLTEARRAPLILLRTAEGPDELVRLKQWVPAELVDRCELKIAPSEATADQILAMANATSADLIALGADRSNTFGETLRGSIAERVVQHSGCPVLCVSGLPVDIPAFV